MQVQSTRDEATSSGVHPFRWRLRRYRSTEHCVTETFGISRSHHDDGRRNSFVYYAGLPERGVWLCSCMQGAIDGANVSLSLKNSQQRMVVRLGLSKNGDVLRTRNLTGISNASGHMIRPHVVPASESSESCRFFLAIMHTG